MSLKAGALFSLFSGVSFTDLQRAASRGHHTRETGPSAVDIAYTTRFAPAAQISVDITSVGNDPEKGRDAA